jgi:hypothetical protein
LRKNENWGLSVARKCGLLAGGKGADTSFVSFGWRFLATKKLCWPPVAGDYWQEEDFFCKTSFVGVGLWFWPTKKLCWPVMLVVWFGLGLRVTERMWRGLISATKLFWLK